MSEQRPTATFGRRMLSRVPRVAIAAAALGSVVVVVIGRSDGGMYGALCSPWAFHCAVVATAALAGAALLRAWRLWAVCAISAIAAAVVAWPPAPPLGTAFAVPGADISGPQSLRLVVANVNGHSVPTPEALDWIRQSAPDVVGIVECNTAWLDALRRIFGEAKHSIARASNDAAGIALFSRYPLHSATIRETPVGVFWFADAVVEHPSGPVRVLIVHPPPPVGHSYTQRRDAEIAWFAQECLAETGRLIIAGDFNETMYGREYRKFVAQTGLRDARIGFGRCPTWPAALGDTHVPSILRIPIDQCFVSPRVTVHSFTVGEAGNSDHAPILVEMTLPTALAMPNQ